MCPFVARWNSFRPAAQPSVTRARRVSSDGGTRRPKCDTKSSSTSQDRNRNSSAPTSTSWSCNRSDDRSIAGSRREPITTAAVGGSLEMSALNTSSDSDASSRWASSITRTIPVGEETAKRFRSPSRLARVVHRDSNVLVNRDSRARRVETASNAAPSVRRNVSGRRSAAPKPTATRLASVRAANCASSVDFPEPAGATTSPRRRPRTCSSDASRRARHRPVGGVTTDDRRASSKGSGVAKNSCCTVRPPRYVGNIPSFRRSASGPRAIVRSNPDGRRRPPRGTGCAG